MFNPAIKILEMKRDLEEIPRARLAEVDRYLKSIRLKKKSKVKQPRTLKGIWANKGFEKIIRAEAKIISLRTELGQQILSKKL